MKLEDIGIKPVLLSKATHLSMINLGKCDLFVPCTSNLEAKEIKENVLNFFGSIEDIVA